MATRTVLAARTTAVLTGGGTADYAADLDMNLTEDGWVTVEILPTLDTLVSITLTLHAGPAATPTGVMTDGTAQISQDLAALTGVQRTVTPGQTLANLGEVQSALLPGGRHGRWWGCWRQRCRHQLLLFAEGVFAH